MTTRELSAGPKFNVTREEIELIGKIVDRGMRLQWSPALRPRRIDLQMDITACHANGTPLSLAAPARRR